MRVPYRKWTEEDHGTWKLLFDRQTPLRHRQIVGEFSWGLDVLRIGPDRIPDLDEINAWLEKLSGFQAIPVEGLVDGREFYSMLARGEFPIGNFIRDRDVLSYTPAPDIFHDMYGHIPFFADPAYAAFCRDFGKAASRHAGDGARFREYERVFWFTIEFGLIHTSLGSRILGAGITSSFDECAYALSGDPEVIPFDLEVVRRQEFRIDQIQPRLFLLRDRAQLYDILRELG